MILRFVRDFARRWWWLLLGQWLLSAAAWAFHKSSQTSLMHLEFAVAVAMSWELMQGLHRTCLAWPMSRRELARGIWLSVAVLGPAVSILAALPGLALCRLTGVPAPPWSSIGVNLVVSFLLGGTLQFTLTGLRTGRSPTLAGMLRDSFFGLMWGLTLSAVGWLGGVIPQKWEEFTPFGLGLMILMALLTVLSWFRTPGMLLARAAPATSSGAGRGMASRTPEKKPATLPHSAGRREVSGWLVWIGVELRWLLMLPAMVLVILTVMKIMGGMGPKAAETAVTGATTQYSSLGALCGMLLIPVFGINCGPLRAFAGLPLSRNLCAWLMALRTPVYSLAMFGAYALFSQILGRSLPGAGIAAWVFVFIGSLTSLLQSLLIRWPSFPAAIGLGMILTPAAILLMPLLFRDNAALIWMPSSAGLMLLISLGLHCRHLRISSKIHRPLPWLQRQALAVH